MADWEDVLKQLLRRGKVSAAAALNTEGKVLATVPDIRVTCQEGEAIVKAVACNYPCMFKVTFGGEGFTCFHKDKQAMVGSAMDKVLVAVRDKDVVMVGLANADSPGSCLYEVTEFAKMHHRRSEKLKKSEKGTRKVIGSGV